MQNLIIPINKNIEKFPDLLEALENLYHGFRKSLKVTLFAAASPHVSDAHLLTHLPWKPFSNPYRTAYRKLPFPKFPSGGAEIFGYTR